MLNKVLANTSLLLGLAGNALAIAIAAGVSISPELHTAIMAFLSSLLTVIGVIFSPNVQLRFGKNADKKP